MKPEIEAIIFAGGRGRRMGELTRNHQKCMLQVDEKPILEHVLDNLQTSFGSAKVIMSIGYKGKEVKDHFGSKYRNIAIEYVKDNGRIEVRQALLLAKNKLHGPFFAIGGDVIVHPDHYLAMAEKLDQEVLGIVSGAIDHAPATTHAVIYTNEDDRIARIHLYPVIPGSPPGTLRDMTLQYFNHDMIAVFEEAPKNERHFSPVIQGAIEQGKLFLAARYNLNWYHFMNPQDLNTSIAFNAYPK